MKRVGVCAEVYSENLGDGIIADSLKHLLTESCEELEVIFVDLSGRRGFPDSQIALTRDRNPFGRHYRPVLRRFPKVWRALFPILWVVRKRQVEERLWREKLDGLDLLIIGGGQLFLDNQAFPLRLQMVGRSAQRIGIPIAIHACGVGKDWSRSATRYFATLVNSDSIVSISTRDPESQFRLSSYLPDIKDEVRLTVDPAVCASETYGLTADIKATLTGLGIISPEDLRKRLTSTPVITDRYLIDFWEEVVILLQKSGHKVELFTNGSHLDHQFAEAVKARLDSNSEIATVPLQPRPLRPIELVSAISCYRTIVAHRLHAAITALSMGIPAIGLVWDDKVRDFYCNAGISEWSVEGPEWSAKDVISCMNSHYDLAVVMDGLKSEAVKEIKSVMDQIVLSS